MAGSPDIVLPEADFEVEQLTVVTLLEGERRNDYPPEELQRLLNEHLHYTVGLVGDGSLLNAGALIDTGANPTLTGLGFSRISAEELTPRIANDPAVIAGIETFRIVTYAFPKGGLRFPRAEAAEGTSRSS